MSDRGNEDVIQALYEIRQLLERIAVATEQLASCVGSDRQYSTYESRIRVSDQFH
jgi:hypothetical protein